jgi:hypothetical protein
MSFSTIVLGLDVGLGVGADDGADDGAGVGPSSVMKTLEPALSRRMLVAQSVMLSAW